MQAHDCIVMEAVRDVVEYVGHLTQEELSNDSLYVPWLHSMQSSTVSLEGMWPCPQVIFKLYACATARRAVAEDEEEALSAASAGASTRSINIMYSELLFCSVLRACSKFAVT